MKRQCERRGRPWRVAAMASVVALACVAGVHGGVADPLLARAFVVNHRPIGDVAELVGPLLSPDGTLTLRPRLKTLVVEDHVSVLDRVEALIESYDLPPRNVEVTLSLFLGTDRREDSGAAGPPGTGFSKEVRGVIETLGDFTKWTAYDPLGSRSITGVEGDRVVANLSDEYRVEFTLDLVQKNRGVVRFGRFALQRLTRDENGVERVEDLYTTGMVVAVGKLHVVGAASGPDSKRALFLTLQAEPR